MLHAKIISQNLFMEEKGYVPRLAGIRANFISIEYVRISVSYGGGIKD